MKADEVIVCEGYTDVSGFDQVGLPRVVVSARHRGDEDHLRSLRSFVRRPRACVLCGRRGQAAADRVYEWERRFDLDVVVANMPSGADPADRPGADPDVGEPPWLTPSRFSAFE